MHYGFIIPDGALMFIGGISAFFDAIVYGTIKEAL